MLVARSLLGLSLAALATVPAAGQATPPRQDPAGTDDAGPKFDSRTLATVNGEPITVDDVAYLARNIPGPLDEQTRRTIMRLLGEQILMASEAARLGVEMTDLEVERYWKKRFGEVPEYVEDEDSGTTLKRQKELTKRRVLAEVYLLHRVGMRQIYVLEIPPDPMLQRIVSVTPQQLKDAFVSLGTQLDRPEAISYAVWLAESQEEAEAVAAELVAGRVPVERQPIRETLPVEVLPEAFAWAPLILDYLLTAEAGDVSPPITTDQGVLVLQVTERLEGAVADFTEVQDGLKSRIQTDRLQDAQRALLESLRLQAVYWPADLFSRDAPGDRRERP